MCPFQSGKKCFITPPLYCTEHAYIDQLGAREEHVAGGEKDQHDDPLHGQTLPTDESVGRM